MGVMSIMVRDRAAVSSSLQHTSYSLADAATIAAREYQLK